MEQKPAQYVAQREVVGGRWQNIGHPCSQTEAAHRRNTAAAVHRSHPSVVDTGRFRTQPCDDGAIDALQSAAGIRLA